MVQNQNPRNRATKSDGQDREPLKFNLKLEDLVSNYND